MEQNDPARVFWVYAEEDEAVAGELLVRAAVLAAQGLVQNQPVPVPALVPALGEDGSFTRPTIELSRADVVVFLCSRALLDDSTLDFIPSVITSSPDLRALAVLVDVTDPGAFLSQFQVLPRDGMPIMGRPNRAEALLDVIQGLLAMVRLRQNSDTIARVLVGSVPRSAQRGAVAAGTSINEIFRLDGPPVYTFIEPPEFDRVRLELRTMGTGLIVEGPSKVGKSTAIRKAMDALEVSSDQQIWWHGQRPPPLEEFTRVLDELLRATRDTWLFIDDFHHLEDERYRRELASAMKVLADLPTRHAKVTLIGINPLGNSLVQVMPDLAGRFRVLRVDIDKDWKRGNKIVELIIRGETAANIRFRRRDEFVVAADGSFFLAQYLCNVAAVKAGVLETPRELVEIDLTPVEVISAIQGELAARFRAPMIDFASFDAVAPPRGASLSLLWLLARSSEGVVPVREARLRFPMLNAAFDWLLASNLSRCFRSHPGLRGLLYYNTATQNLTMEDPQLKFFLRALRWDEFAEASGHGQVSFHPEDGPLWSAIGLPHASSITVPGHDLRDPLGTDPPSPGRRRVLHLSDLHFAAKDQATIWYAQLAADLREQQVDRLDALVVSGDLVNRAEPLEYDAARLFLEKLMLGFRLSAAQVALVPGNHDVSWSVSEEAYEPVRRSKVRTALQPGTYIEHDGNLIELRNEETYRKRFLPFCALYRAIKGAEFPLEYEDQGTIDDLGEAGICVLGLNSAWEIDHHFRDRATIHPGSLANALLKLGPRPAGQLRIAMFHHPLHGGDDARIRDTGFLQQLAVHGFELVLHGHVHKADAELYRYDRSEGGRRIEVIAAGTLGAPTREWVPGYPLEYNLLLVDPDRVIVETRCRREINGAWEPDARWRQGSGRDPLPRYVVSRQRSYG